MKLRIIGGSRGGRFLDSPDTTRTHPMGERIRGSLFNIIGDVEGLSVLDAFAGSGSIGLEMLSRGAKNATFIEKDRIAQKVIEKNIADLDFKNESKLIRGSVASWDETNDKSAQFDIIVADPPYHDLQLSTVSRLQKYLSPKGLMILSYPGRELAPTVNGVVVVDIRLYGDAALAFYRLDTASDHNEE